MCKNIAEYTHAMARQGVCGLDNFHYCSPIEQARKN